jgi:hypothetical protein
VEDRGNLQARFRHKIALDGIHRSGDEFRRLVPQETNTSDVTNSLLDQRVRLVSHQSIAVEQRQRHHTGDLHRLFFDSHLLHQIVGATHQISGFSCGGNSTRFFSVLHLCKACFGCCVGS